MALCLNPSCSNTVTPGTYCYRCNLYCPVEVKLGDPVLLPSSRRGNPGNNVPALLAFAAGAVAYILSAQDTVSTLVAAVVGWMVGKTWIGKVVMAIIYIGLAALVLKFCGGLANSYR